MYKLYVTLIQKVLFLNFSYHHKFNNSIGKLDKYTKKKTVVFSFDLLVLLKINMRRKVQPRSKSFLTFWCQDYLEKVEIKSHKFSNNGRKKGFLSNSTWISKFFILKKEHNKIIVFWNNFSSKYYFAQIKYTAFSVNYALTFETSL